MGRPFILYYDEIPDQDCIHCRICRTRIAFVRDHFANISNHAWVFHNMFNVEVPEDEGYHLVVDGKTLAYTYCIKCRNLLGWKLIAIAQYSRYLREGIFIMTLRNHGPIEQGPNNQDGDANEQNADQDGDANEQVPNEQGGDVNAQHVGANEQNTDQDEWANEQIPNDQQGGAK
ncbi:protein yippee-like At3g08990 [Solanum dulcamara]|uniref:protein yippee-like At3g08990 n=1 Tax=Solanum dulcamara TaxID=45834 RepID=UPI002486A4E6|nr:protein yippee-like At3g08990 [Solanum dulcamara]